MAVGLITCGEVEDVVGALTPVGRGVAQVFHDLLVELRLLLVAEEAEGQEESLESEVGQVEETTTWMTMEMEMESHGGLKVTIRQTE